MGQITLSDIIDLIDYNRESDISKIQICQPNMNWEDFDEVGTSSCLLIPFYKAEIKEMRAISEDVIRVDIDWSGFIEKNTQSSDKI